MMDLYIIFGLAMIVDAVVVCKSIAILRSERSVSMDYKSFYETNENFKTYTDKYCKSYGVTVMDALGLKLVQNVADEYAKREKDHPQTSKVMIDCGC